ncbi:MAG: glutamine synthetase family protein [Hyphomicrobiales bacterium]
MTSNPQTDPETAMMAVVDYNGILRGKRLTGGYIQTSIKDGVRMPLSIVGVDIWGNDIENSAQVFDNGDADGFFMATNRSPLLQSWFDEPTNLIPIMMVEDDGSANGVCPRGALAKIEAEYEAKGLSIVSATELEFHLIKRTDESVQPDGDGRLKTSAAVECIDAMQEKEAFFKEVYATADAWGIGLGAAISEASSGQYEINLKHQAGAVQIADNTYFLKRIIKGVAKKHGLEATFMAKPFGDGAGNGLHVHFSVLDADGDNIFDNGGDEGTPVLRHALAGLELFMQSHMLLFAPHANSYRRFLPGSFAPTKIVWGYDNRLTALRVPNGPPKARRIEHRVAGADANPYMVLAAIMGAALYGMNERLTPSEPVVGNAYNADRRELPLNWTQAVEAFSQFEKNQELFDARVIRMLGACKQQEQITFGVEISKFEYETYVETV